MKHCRIIRQLKVKYYILYFIDNGKLDVLMLLPTVTIPLATITYSNCLTQGLMNIISDVIDMCIQVFKKT